MRLNCPAKGLAAGLIGGAFASWTMNQFHAAAARLSPKPSGGETQESGESQEPATVKAAEAASRAILRRPLPAERKQAAGSLVHYGFGTFMGGLYGMSAGRWSWVRSAAGLPFGAGLWLVSDEILVPALGLSKPPREYPVRVHATALGAHLVYAATLEWTRRVVRSCVLDHRLER